MTKALTLHQPWASLCVPLAPDEKPIKTIETRTKPTGYRGRLLIHAAKTVEGIEALADAGGGFDETERRIYGAIGHFQASYRLGHHNGERVVRINDGNGKNVDVPLGAIVGSCTLVDVVPIGMVTGPHVGDFPHEGELPHQQGGLWLIGRSALNKGAPTRIEDQRPYGDFTPGRYAWLLEDAERTDERCPACWGDGGRWYVTAMPGRDFAYCLVCLGKGSCDPIPAKGKHGLWEWTP